MKYYAKAVSLIEILVALAVLSFGVIGLVKFQSYMLSQHLVSSQQAEAIAIARNYIMQARHEVLLSTMTPPAGSSYTYPGSGSHTVTKENTTYTVSYTFTKTNSPEYETLSVNVSWLDPSNVTRSVDLATRIANLPATKMGEAMDAL